MPDDQAVVVGRVAGSYGVRGWLRIEPFNDPGDSVLLTARRWLLRRPAAVQGAIGMPVAPPAQGARRMPPTAGTAAVPVAGAPNLPATVSVLRCKLQGGALLASIEGVDVKEAADALRGCEIAVDRSEFPPSGDDEFYWVDLIGCGVVTPEGVDLGLVESLDDHGAHPLLRVRDPAGRERLIPFVAAHVPEVDIHARRIVVDWDPEF